MPFTAIEPLRLPTSPRMDLSVEVRPAPLRPSSVTPSPLFTVRSTPCSTCDSPYQACRFAMLRTASAMGGPHVRLHHRGIGGDLGVASLGEHRAASKDRDPVADARNDAHVVLDHQHGAAHGHFLDEVLHAVDVLVAHAGGGLVAPPEGGLHG